MKVITNNSGMHLENAMPFDLAKENLFEHLSSGEKVLCPKCGKGFFIPFNAPAHKAHSFNCSNPDCNCHYHWTSALDIE